MRTIAEVLEAERCYFTIWGRPTEVDMSINDLSRELVEVMAAAYPAVYLGNLTGSGSLVPYEGQLIHNFEYGLCVPVDDPMLKELLCRYSDRPDMVTSDAIFTRLMALGGHYLAWA